MFLAFVSDSPSAVTEVAGTWQSDVSYDEVVWSDSHVSVRALRACTHTPIHGLPVWGRARIEEPRPDGAQSDLATLGQRLAANGMEAIVGLCGSFGIASWNPVAKTFWAFRDPLGLSALYYRQRNDGLLVSNSLDLLGQGRIDREYIAAFIAEGHLDLDRTIWKDVWSVPADRALVWKEGRTSLEPFWSANSFKQRSSGDIRESARQYRVLAERAVALNLDQDGTTWADLSGGLDSSTVVSLAAHEAAHDPRKALGGTVSFFGSIGDEDETRFSDAVAKRHGVKNLKLGDTWPWCDDGLPPPLTPHPTRDYPFYARDRWLGRTLASEGARSLLSGNGPDNCLPRTTFHIADHLMRGEFAQGIDQLWECSLVERRRLLEMLANDVARPLLPRRLQRLMARKRLRVPSWIRADFGKENRYDEHMLRRHLHLGPAGSICQTLVSQRLKELSNGLLGWRSVEPIAVRHPLLYKPLVEFCLELPHSHRTSLVRFKPVLRLAMSDLLPDAVLNRRTKAGSLLRRYGWAVARERELISNLLASPILADLGCIEPSKLLAAVENASQGKNEALRPLFLALSLETWLSARFGRYDHCLTSTRRPSNERKAASA